MERGHRGVDPRYGREDRDGRLRDPGYTDRYAPSRYDDGGGSSFRSGGVINEDNGGLPRAHGVYPPDGRHQPQPMQPQPQPALHQPYQLQQQQQRAPYDLASSQNQQHYQPTCSSLSHLPPVVTYAHPTAPWHAASGREALQPQQQQQPPWRDFRRAEDLHPPASLPQQRYDAPLPERYKPQGYEGEPEPESRLDRERARSRSRDRRVHRSRSREGRRRRRSSSDEDSYHDYDRDRDRNRSNHDRFASDVAAGLDGLDPPRRRRRSRSRSRSRSGDDGDRPRRRYGSPDPGGRSERPAGGRSRQAPPSCTVYIKNLPLDLNETELFKLLEAFPNVTAVRIGRDRSTGRNKGFAFVDFASEADSATLMAHAERDGLFSGAARLVVEYSIAPGGGGAGAGGGGGGGVPGGGMGNSSCSGTLDWICSMCTSVNFARRLECYQCAAVRPANPQRVPSDKDGPSNVLKVSGLEEDATEDMLGRLFSAHAPVTEVRMVRDKFSGAPRSFAFVQYAEVQDATRAMNGLQGVRAGGSTLRICYARDRAVGPAAASGAALAKGQDALQAAQAMQQYSGWEPKAFGQDGDEEAAPAAPAPTAELESSSAATAAATSGFVYDSASGYYYDAKSGYYYDANSTLYYHPSTSKWYLYDKATGAYAVAGGGSVAGAAATGGLGEAGSSSAAQSAIAATEAALSEAAAKRAAAAAAAGGVSAACERKRSACIGAAPQLSSQGLMAAVQQMEERELQNKALAAQKLREEQKRLQQLGGAKQVAAPAAPVTGVIHKGKWASRGAADQM